MTYRTIRFKKASLKLNAKWLIAQDRFAIWRSNAKN